MSNLCSLQYLSSRPCICRNARLPASWRGQATSPWRDAKGTLTRCRKTLGKRPPLLVPQTLTCCWYVSLTSDTSLSLGANLGLGIVGRTDGSLLRALLYMLALQESCTLPRIFWCTNPQRQQNVVLTAQSLLPWQWFPSPVKLRPYVHQHFPFKGC